ncbi:MAG: penicillin-binding protein 2, partial [Marmoricola sp.]
MSRSQRNLRGNVHVRLRVGLVLIAMLLSLFGARLFQLQGIDSRSYATRAAEAGLDTIELPAERGRILDRNGTPLAQSVAGLMIVADPTRTAPNAEAIAKILADELGLDYFDSLAKLTKSGTRFVYLARRVPSTLASKVMTEIRTRELVGVDTRTDPLRVYPAGDVAANLLGFVGEDKNPEGVIEPAGGLERAFNKMLAGKDGTETYEVGGGNRIPLGENSRVKPVNGKDLSLTIDRDLQWYTQRLLRTAVDGSGAENGAAVVLDARTGEVLSLADYPTYDPNFPGKASTDNLRSRALTDVYEPGSVEKVLTAASLIDAGKVTPATRIKVPAELPVLDRKIGDWFDHGDIKLTMAGVIARSSNIGTALAATQFTNEELRSYLDKFGLGRRTDVGLIGETRGLLPPASVWSSLSRAQISFGQGVSVSALQMAAAVNTLANGGEFISPSLVKGRATTSTGQEVGTETAVRRRVVSPEA